MNYKPVMTFWLATVLTLSTPAAVVRAKDADKARADALTKAYQAISTYQAKWQVLSTEGPQDHRSLVEVAFDRKNRQLLVHLQPQELKEKQWVSQAGGQLVVHDGKKLSKAMHDGTNWTKSSIDSPKNFSYRDVRRVLVMFYPVDLPLLLSDQPFAEWVQGEVTTTKAMAPDPKDPKARPGLMIKGQGGPEITARLDPKTNMLQEVLYGPMRFELMTLEIDKPLPDRIFDFDATLKRIQETK